MTNEEQVLAAIEEIANQLNDLKKSINSPANKAEVDLSPINDKLDNMKEQLQKISYANSSRDSESNRISGSLRNLQDILSMKQNEVVVRYIEVKQPQKWILWLGIYFILSISVCFFVVYRNIKLNEKIEVVQANDFKYRFLKLKSFDLSELRKDIDNTYDLTTSVDAYYKKNTKEVQGFVIKREEEVNRVNEANEIARQKEIEAKTAQEEAKRIKSKYSGNNQNE